MDPLSVPWCSEGSRFEVRLKWIHFGCLAALTVVSTSLVAVRKSNSGERVNLSKSGSERVSSDATLDRQYDEWVSRLPAERQAWEVVLQQELGGFYLPRHKRDKVAGTPNAWDYVKDDPALPRVLLLGDSISRGYTLTVRAQLTGRANVHRAPANCGPVSLGLEKLGVWLGDGNWDVIHFNFGIHNRGTPVDEYARQLERLVKRLKDTQATLVWASTTPIPDVPAQQLSADSIVARNTAAIKVMTEHRIAVNDLYAAMLPNADQLRLSNDVHYSQEGYEFLGTQVADYLLQLPRLKSGLSTEKDKNLHSDGSPWGLKLGDDSDPNLPRVLLIGDSILNGYRRQVSESLTEEAIVDAWVNPHFQSEKLNLLLGEVLQGREYDVVHFNVGLHGWQEGRIKTGTFKPLTRSYVQVIQERQPTARLIWASSTPILTRGKPSTLDPEANPRIVKHNRLAAEVMREMGVPVNDFYGLLLHRLELARGDEFHWTAPAYKILGDKAARAIRNALEQQDRPDRLSNALEN